MPIISWTIEEGAIQVNRDLSIVERYQHDDGRETMLCALVDPQTDLDAYAAARAAEIDAAEAASKPAMPALNILSAIEDARRAYYNNDITAVRAALKAAIHAAGHGPHG